MHFDEFYTALFSHNTFILSFYKKNMAKKSAESYVSLKGNDKAISILQNVIKVMVVLKKGQWSIKTWLYLKRHLSFLFFYFRCANKQTKNKQTKNSSKKVKSHIEERFPLPLGAWSWLRYFIVALLEPSI